MRTLELTPSGVIGTLAVLVVAAVCIRLGLWQLDRREEKLARNAVMQERLDARPVALARALRDTAGLTFRQATMTGRLDPARSVVLAGRSHGGAPGVQVLTPVRVRDGAVLVNRGWLPSPDASTVDLSPIEIVGEVEVRGILLPFPEVESGRDADGEPGRFRTTWYRLDGEAIRASYPYPVAPLYLQATERIAGPGAPDSARTYPVLLAPPGPDAGPHLSYAIQWFSFATIFLVGWAVMLVRRGGDGDRAVATPR